MSPTRFYKKVLQKKAIAREQLSMATEYQLPDGSPVAASDVGDQLPATEDQLLDGSPVTASDVGEQLSMATEDQLPDGLPITASDVGEQVSMATEDQLPDGSPVTASVVGDQLSMAQNFMIRLCPCRQHQFLADSLAHLCHNTVIYKMNDSLYG